MAWPNPKRARSSRKTRKIRSKLKFIAVILTISFLVFGAVWIKNNSEDIGAQKLNDFKLKTSDNNIDEFYFEEEEDYEDEEEKLDEFMKFFENKDSVSLEEIRAHAKDVFFGDV